MCTPTQGVWQPAGCVRASPISPGDACSIYLRLNKPQGAISFLPHFFFLIFNLVSSFVAFVRPRGPDYRLGYWPIAKHPRSRNRSSRSHRCPATRASLRRTRRGARCGRCGSRAARSDDARKRGARVADAGWRSAFIAAASLIGACAIYLAADAVEVSREPLSIGVRRGATPTRETRAREHRGRPGRAGRCAVAQQGAEALGGAGFSSSLIFKNALFAGVRRLGNSLHVRPILDSPDPAGARPLA